MIIHYKESPDGALDVYHVVTHHHHDYADSVGMLNGAFIEVRDQGVELHDIKLERRRDGKIVGYVEESGSRRYLIPAPERFGIGSPTAFAVGVESAFTGVPPGTAISLDGTRVATMDDSGVYEVIVRTPGFYHFRFELDGYRPLEVMLEANP